MLYTPVLHKHARISCTFQHSKKYTFSTFYIFAPGTLFFMYQSWPTPVHPLSRPPTPKPGSPSELFQLIHTHTSTACEEDRCSGAHPSHFLPSFTHYFTHCTVIRLVSTSAKFGICTVVSLNGTLVEEKKAYILGLM